MTAPLQNTDLFDALTLALERADALTIHLEDRLSELSDSVVKNEIYALSLIASAICDQHAMMRGTANMLFKTKGDTTGGAR
jgi:hypothetical protein